MQSSCCATACTRLKLQTATSAQQTRCAAGVRVRCCACIHARCFVVAGRWCARGAAAVVATAFPLSTLPLLLLLPPLLTIGAAGAGRPGAAQHRQAGRQGQGRGEQRRWLIGLNACVLRMQRMCQRVLCARAAGWPQRQGAVSGGVGLLSARLIHGSCRSAVCLLSSRSSVQCSPLAACSALALLWPALVRPCVHTTRPRHNPAPTNALAAAHAAPHAARSRCACAAPSAASSWATSRCSRRSWQRRASTWSRPTRPTSTSTTCAS